MERGPKRDPAVAGGARAAGGRRTRGREREAVADGEERSGVAAAHDEHAGEIADVVVPPLAEQGAGSDADGERIEAESAPTVSSEPPTILHEIADETADKVADLAQHHVGDAPEPAVTEPAVAPAPPAPEGADEAEQAAEPHAGAENAAAEPATTRRPEPVSTEADPARPKRAGWWSRAKASLGG